jgi:hypothetical protein
MLSSANRILSDTSENTFMKLRATNLARSTRQFISEWRIPEAELLNRAPAHPQLERENRANLLIISFEVNGKTASVPLEA